MTHHIPHIPHLSLGRTCEHLDARLLKYLISLSLFSRYHSTLLLGNTYHMRKRDISITTTKAELKTPYQNIIDIDLECFTETKIILKRCECLERATDKSYATLYVLGAIFIEKNYAYNELTIRVMTSLFSCSHLV
jgi:hypothetical protein